MLKRRGFLRLIGGLAAAPVAARAAELLPAAPPPAPPPLPPTFAISGDRLVTGTLSARHITASDLCLGSIRAEKLVVPNPRNERVIIHGNSMEGPRK